MQVEKSDWDHFFHSIPSAHVLQSSPWGDVKSHAGWYPIWIVAAQTGAQILFRRLPAGLTIGYIPKGPLGEVNDLLWSEITDVCHRHHAVFLQVEPDVWEDDSSGLVDWLDRTGTPVQPTQPRQTILLDINGGENQVLARMKQKTRYNIHLAEKKEVEIKPLDDMEAFSRLMQLTSERDGFGVHTTEYYRQVYQLFVPGGNGIVLSAVFKEALLAAIFVLRSGERAWYFYGASSNSERNRMPTYLLQWEAIRWAIGKGCSQYDLWGIPDSPEETLEEQFNIRSDGLWGVYRFKRGFGGQIKRSAGAWDVVYQPLLYRMYQWVMARRRADYGG